MASWRPVLQVLFRRISPSSASKLRLDLEEKFRTYEIISASFFFKLTILYPLNILNLLGSQNDELEASLTGSTSIPPYQSFFSQ